MLANNDFKNCPLITGVNKDEGTLFVLLNYNYFDYVNTSVPPFISEETFDNGLKQLLTGYQDDLIRDGVKQQYVTWSEADKPDADYIDAYSGFYGDDENFVCPSDLETRAHAKMAAEAEEEHGTFQYHCHPRSQHVDLHQRCVRTQVVGVRTHGRVAVCLWLSLLSAASTQESCLSRGRYGAFA